MTTRQLALIAFGLTAVVGCKKEERAFNSQLMNGAENQPRQLSDLNPGPDHSRVPAVNNTYENNAWGISQGKRLYEFYNCVGCHAHGGGGMGPALMDARWIYGSNPEQIFATITEGRPNGMPSFHGKIPDDQVWQIAAYVRSLGGLISTGTEPAREDHMKGAPPENSLPKQTPTSANLPTSAGQPP